MTTQPTVGAGEQALSDEQLLLLTVMDLANLAYQDGRDERSPWSLQWQKLSDRIEALYAQRPIPAAPAGLAEAIKQLGRIDRMISNSGQEGDYPTEALFDVLYSLPASPSAEGAESKAVEAAWRAALEAAARKCELMDRSGPGEEFADAIRAIRFPYGALADADGDGTVASTAGGQ